MTTKPQKYPNRWIDQVPDWYWNKLYNEERDLLLRIQKVIDDEK